MIFDSLSPFLSVLFLLFIDFVICNFLLILTLIMKPVVLNQSVLRTLHHLI